MVMLYPKHYSAYGYCEELITQYKQKYINFLEEEIIDKSIGFIINRIRLIIEQNKNNKELFIKTIIYLSCLDQISKEKFLETIKEIGPPEAVGILFWAAQKSENTASLIENNMAFSVKVENRNQYLEFIKEITLRCAKELAIANTLKPTSSKKVTFSEKFVDSVSVREYAIQTESGDSKELNSSEKEAWLNRPKQEFKAYSKKEQQRDSLERFHSQETIKENIEPAKKKSRNNSIPNI